ncbi:MAG: succinylglutamate desuccinylase/aspartoacylase family protein [Anaerolineae bacterium]|nr:succinylglutamate desuccinylase/aspartoacylase family protein [Anaerolineae bacterium]
MSGEAWQLGPLHVEPEATVCDIAQVDLGVAQIDFPITLINGRVPDPVVLVTAGMDGDEYAAIEAAQQLAEAIDPAQLDGRVMICPVLDPISFEAGSGQNPLDGLFLKHVFPGDLEGKPTQRLAYFIFENFVRQADAWIDLHVCETSEDALALVWAAQGDDAEINSQNRILLEYAGAPIGLLNPMEQVWGPGEVAALAGKPLLIAQAGRRAVADPEAVQFHVSVVERVLTGMDMLADSTSTLRPTLYGTCVPVVATHTGLWYPAIRPGATVQAGQTLGVVRRLDGSAVLQEVTSPADGVAVIVRDGLAARPRLRLVLIACEPDEKEA